MWSVIAIDSDSMKQSSDVKGKASAKASAGTGNLTRIELTYYYY